MFSIISMKLNPKYYIIIFSIGKSKKNHQYLMIQYILKCVLYWYNKELLDV